MFPMSIVHIDRIRQSILDHSPRKVPVREKTRQAAVSVVLRPREENGTRDTEALFILRAQKEGDPWSGHMAFPGGHLEADDESLRHAAERETHEEIGLDLIMYGEFIGQIDPVQANPRGRDLDMVVTPFVYELKHHDVRFEPNYEVADVLWGSLRDMHTGDAHTTGQFMVGGERVSYPGYGVGDEIVWGLTYRMLDLFFAMLDPDWVER
jgi:8-oxo-dGTP pyrophosphatase MutT (NUDIX family)